ncbi:hypothetical protein AOLI_G00165940 [Acnodon oligacanthus]
MAVSQLKAFGQDPSELRGCFDFPAVWSVFLSAQPPLAGGADQSEPRVALRGRHGLVNMRGSDQWQAVFTLPGLRGTSCAGKEDHGSETRASTQRPEPALQLTQPPARHSRAQLPGILPSPAAPRPTCAALLSRSHSLPSDPTYSLLCKDFTYQKDEWGRRRDPERRDFL